VFAERYLECRSSAEDLENHVSETSCNQAETNEEKLLQQIHLQELDSSITEVKNILQTLSEKVSCVDCKLNIGSRIYLFNIHRHRQSAFVFRAVHPSEAMMHFLPVSDFPLFPKKNSDSVENFPNFTFSKEIFDFHPPKFRMTFFNFEFPPYCRCFSRFPPLFWEKMPFFIHTLHVLDTPVCVN